MYIKNIWRYPIKSMGGEELNSARLTSLGIEGDRLVWVENADSHVITSRTHPLLLGHHGSIGPDGTPRVDGREWDSDTVAADVIAAGGIGAKLARCEGPEQFDVLPLLIATDGAIEAFGQDYRRLRPNLVIGGVEGLGEREWEGGFLTVGSVVIGVQDLRLRCIMTSYDPDTTVQNTHITQDIYRRFEGKLALNCYVIATGDIAVGDEVTFHDHAHEFSSQ